MSTKGGEGVLFSTLEAGCEEILYWAWRPFFGERIQPYVSLVLWCLFSLKLVTQMVKSMPAMWETCVQSLGWEDPLEEGMATHSSILAWRIPVDRGASRLQSIGSQRVGHN